MNKKVFIKIILGLSEVFTPDKEFSGSRMDIYWNVFKNWEDEKFIRACELVLSSKTISTFPLPAEIVEQDGSIADESLANWLISREVAENVGRNKTVVFDNPVIHSVINAMGGWATFCTCPERERPFKQREFERLYKLFKDRGDHPDRVSGIYESSQITWGETPQVVDFRKGMDKAGAIMMQPAVDKLKGVIDAEEKDT